MCITLCKLYISSYFIATTAASLLQKSSDMTVRILLLTFFLLHTLLAGAQAAEDVPENTVNDSQNIYVLNQHKYSIGELFHLLGALLASQ